MFTCMTLQGIIVRVEVQSWWPETDDQFKITLVESPKMQDASEITSKLFDDFASLIKSLETL